MSKCYDVYMPEKILNPKGDIYHFLKKDDCGYLEFGEAYFSTISQGQIKAWKLHREITSNLVVISGAVKFVVVTENCEFVEVVLSSSDYRRLVIHPMTWYGFSNIGDETAIIGSIISSPHDKCEQMSMPLNELDYKW